MLQGCRVLKWCPNLPALLYVAVVQAVKVVLEPTCRALCCSGAVCLSGVESYLPCTVCRDAGCKMVLEPTCRALCCWVAGCSSCVGTYLLGPVLQVCRLLKQRRKLSARHCVAVVQAV